MNYYKKIFFLCAFALIPPLASKGIDPLKHASISIYAVDTKTNRVLIDENSALSLIPASCMKIVTTIAALHLLGPDYRFETTLAYDGLIDSSKTLHGNLYIRGGGDPCLGSDRIAGSLPWKAQLQKWAHAIEALGIQKIEGRVLADTSRWEKALAVSSWSWEDLGNYYGAGACALSFHENAYHLFFKSGDQVSDPAQILRTDPPLLNLTLHNEVVTASEGTGDQACIYGTELSSTQWIRGTIPKSSEEFVIRGAIPDPAGLVADLLLHKLQEKEIAIKNNLLDSKTERIIFDMTYSPTVGEIVYETNQKSINLYAEHLLKKMGELSFKEGSTSLGIQAVGDFFRLRQIDLEGCHIVDGSGLSRKNLMTTKALVQILLEMKKSTLYPLFLKSLPLGKLGERGKSGSMSQIRGYTGYLGDTAFAILINSCCDSNAMRAKIDEILLTLKSRTENDILQ